MANIALINYCNLNCPYCFANDYITEEEKHAITMEELDRILEFLSRTRVGRVGLIGGEPTIHPEFDKILKRISEFCKTYNTRASIFTNGIRLYDYARLIDDNMGCLVNLNHPDVVGKSNWDNIIRSLDRMKLCSNIDRVTLGINLYSTMRGYDYLFDTALKYKKDCVRVSYVAPTNQCSSVDKDEYYNNAKEIFIPFVEKAKSLGIRVHLDCNHIPRCYFTEKELDIIESVVDGYHEYCEPVVDITPDFKGTACFGAYKLYDLSGFDNILEVERYLRFKRLFPLSEANNSGKCSTCNKHDNLSCQGGCLAFVNK